MGIRGRKWMEVKNSCREGKKQPRRVWEALGWRGGHPFPDATVRGEDENIRHGLWHERKARTQLTGLN